MYHLETKKCLVECGQIITRDRNGASDTASSPKYCLWVQTVVARKNQLVLPTHFRVTRRFGLRRSGDRIWSSDITSSPNYCSWIRTIAREHHLALQTLLWEPSLIITNPRFHESEMSLVRPDWYFIHYSDSEPSRVRTNWRFRHYFESEPSLVRSMLFCSPFLKSLLWCIGLNLELKARNFD